MTPALLLAYVHLVASVLVVGYFLFWLVMTVGLPRLEPASEVAPLTAAMLVGARWPPAGVPWKLRLTLPGLGWAFIAVLVASGAGLALIAHAALTSALGAKLVLLLLLVGGHARLTRGPTPGLARVTLALALAVVAVSVLLPR
jgi:hypothetical protein